MSASNRPNEITLTRFLDAPVAVVWEAWNDPAQAAQWWGPRGFTLTTHSKDLRPGGTWKYTMHGPDGADYPNVTKYLEIVPYQKLVYDHGGTETGPPMFRVTVVFTEIGDQTKMDMTMGFPTPEAAENTRKFIKKASGDSTWDRLAEYLAETRSGRQQFIINRSFAAPLEVLFDMWTKPEHFAQWLPPTGFTMKFLHADIRPGGGTKYCMFNEALTMYGRAQYLAIERPHRIVYTQQFCDEQGNISRHPKAPTWPETMLTTVQLTAEGPEQTRVTVTWEPYGPVTPAELEVFRNMRGSMTMGWTGSFDKLEEHLAARSAP